MDTQVTERDIDADFLKVKRWLTRVMKGKKGTRPPIAAIRSVFESIGADLSVVDDPEVQKSLKSGTNKWQAPARKKILGPLYTEYQHRVDAWVHAFLYAGGKIPKGKNRKYGSNHLIGWVLALGFLKGASAKEIIPYMESAIQNFKDWDERKVPVGKRIKLPIWNAKDRTPVTVPVLPPGFVAYFITLLDIWRRRPKGSDVEKEDAE